MIEKIVFYAAGLSAIVFSLLAISRRQPIFGVLYLFLTGLTISLLFAIKNSFFLALIQIIVYVGAVLVLFVFVIAMMNLKISELFFGAFRRWRYLVVIVSIPILLILGSAIFSQLSLREQKFTYFTAKDVGGALYKDLFFQFEYLSIFLIVAIVITVFVGSRFEKDEKIQRR
ncbi:MAG: NADH-quinone oxidoreductase subunit J [Candidatus Calescibacterium sp.]|nr:NADH-quinone oxidoreductase subunit J [Candidatus Calescibacterium sp.]MCX7734567.1 NADH-quinone oxidoreductase subunit J [bacterium]